MILSGVAQCNQIVVDDTTSLKLGELRWLTLSIDEQEADAWQCESVEISTTYRSSKKKKKTSRTKRWKFSVDEWLGGGGGKTSHTAQPLGPGQVLSPPLPYRLFTPPWIAVAIQG